MKIGDLVTWSEEFINSHQMWNRPKYGIIVDYWGRENHPRIVWSNGEKYGTDKQNVEILNKNQQLIK